MEGYLKDFCSRCKHFDSQYGACTLLRFNTRSRENIFEKKCGGKFLELADGAPAVMEDDSSPEEEIGSEGEAEERKSEIVRRNPWLAGLLSLLALGLGQIYNGQWKKGAALLLGWQVCVNLFFFSRFWVHFAGLTAMFLFAGLFWLWVVFDAVRFARKCALTEPKVYQRWYYYLLFYAVFFLCAGANAYVIADVYDYRAFRVPTGSMENTLLFGDYIIADKHSYVKHEPAAGDVVVFRYPRQPNLSYVKRCAAVGGQTVEIRDKQLLVDGVRFENPPSVKFTRSRTIPKGSREREIFSPNAEPWNRDNYGPITVPKNCYFVLGDNRDNSADSRYWGFLPRENIVGKALYVYFSWDKHSSAVRWDRFGKKIE
jgi:signal peptidase I